MVPHGGKFFDFSKYGEIKPENLNPQIGLRFLLILEILFIFLKSRVSLLEVEPLLATVALGTTYGGLLSR